TTRGPSSPGSSTRMLAAGSGGTSAASPGPSSTTRTSRGVRVSTERTAAGWNGGGSRRGISVIGPSREQVAPLAGKWLARPRAGLAGGFARRDVGAQGLDQLRLAHRRHAGHTEGTGPL